MYLLLHDFNVCTGNAIANRKTLRGVQVSGGSQLVVSEGDPTNVFLKVTVVQLLGVKSI